MTAIQRAIEYRGTTGYKSEHHFLGVTKMVALGSGAERRVEAFMFTCEQVQNNTSIRQMLDSRRLKPDRLLPEES